MSDLQGLFVLVTVCEVISLSFYSLTTTRNLRRVITQMIACLSVGFLGVAFPVYCQLIEYVHVFYMSPEYLISDGDLYFWMFWLLAIWSINRVVARTIYNIGRTIWQVSYTHVKRLKRITGLCGITYYYNPNQDTDHFVIIDYAGYVSKFSEICSCGKEHLPEFVRLVYAEKAAKNEWEHELPKVAQVPFAKKRPWVEDENESN